MLITFAWENVGTVYLVVTPLSTTWLQLLNSNPPYFIITSL